MKFTQTNVAKLRPPEGKNDITIWDDGMPGFGIRFRDGGAGAYVIQFFVKGKQAKLGLGKVAKVTLDDAQTEAKQHFAKIAKGENPAAERAQAASKARSAVTIGELLPLFIKDQQARGRVPTYISEIERSLFRIGNDGKQNAYFAELHQYAPDAVTRRMVATELNEIHADCGPIAMTRSRAHLSKFWSWAIAEGIADLGNPVTGTKKFSPKLRDRQHTDAELKAIWSASDDANDYDVIQKLIMLTGARRNQIGQLTRKEIKRNEMEIVLKGAGRSKNGTTFILPLSEQALALINLVWDRRQDDTGYLFGDGGEGGFSGWSKAAVAFKSGLGDDVEDYCLHDFRRTFQNVGQTKVKIDLHITEACMNHIGGVAKAGSKKHYNFAEYADEKREALQDWADYIDGVVGRRKFRAAA